MLMLQKCVLSIYKDIPLKSVKKKRILAVDYGEKRIGISQTDSKNLFAQPVGTVDEKGFFLYLDKVESDDGIDKILIGYPLSYDGSRNEATQKVDLFIKKMKRRHPSILVLRWNEYDSTRKADAFLKQRGVSRKRRRKQGRLDVVVASMILDGYLTNSLTEDKINVQ